MPYAIVTGGRSGGWSTRLFSAWDWTPTQGEAAFPWPEDTVLEKVLLLAKARQAVRYAEADRLRAELRAVGVAIECAHGAVTARW